MKKIIIFCLLSFTPLFLTLSFTVKNPIDDKNKKAAHCFEFRVTCAGKTGFYDTVQASSWSEATKKINAKYLNCKATQVKQKDC